MLQSMRQIAHSWIVKGLMLFLIISFSIWGIGDIFRGNPLQKTAAKVGDVQISVQELTRSFDQNLARARQGMENGLTAQQARQMGLLDKTLDGLINQALVEQDIRRLGIDVPESSVLKLLADQPQFRAKDGSFNKELFREMLAKQNLSERGFIAQEQKDLARQTLMSALAGARSVPQTMIDALYRAAAQKRILDVVTIDPAKLGEISAPDSAALQAFYEKNQTLFTAPEYRALTVATLSSDAMMKDIVIPDDQVKKEYDARGDKLAHPEQRDIVQVVVQDETRARTLARQAQASGDLAATAKINKESAIPMSKVDQESLLPDLAKAVFALEPGKVAEPVKSQLGWHVVQVQAVSPAGKPSFEEIKGKLRDDLRRDQAVEATTKAVNQLDDQLAAGHSLDDIADGLRMRLIKVPAVDASGLTPEGKEPGEFPNKEQALKDGFAQSAGETSPVEDDKNGTYYVVRTDDITPAAVKPLAEIKDKVVQLWKMREQLTKAQGQAQKILQDLGAGSPLSSFDGKPGIDIRQSMPLSQLGDTDPTLPQPLIARALKLRQGEAALDDQDGKPVVVRVASVVNVDAKTDDPRKNRISGLLLRKLDDDRVDQYIAHLRTVFPVKIDNALMERLRQQEN